MLCSFLASAQTNTEQAETLNAEGKDFANKGDYRAAAEKFQEALAIVPDGRYRFNLCVIYYRQGLYADAKAQCDAVQTSNAPAATKSKASKISGTLAEKLNGQGQPPATAPGTDTEPAPTDPSGGGTPYNPNTTTPAAPPQNTPPLPPPTSDKENYQWAFGLHAGGVARNFGEDFSGAKEGIQFGGRLDFIMDEESKWGASFRTSFSRFADNNDFVPKLLDSLTLWDIGGSLYYHVQAGPIIVTPSLGMAIAFLFPEGSFQNSFSAMSTVSVRPEVRAGIKLGDHEIGATLFADWYMGSDDDELFDLNGDCISVDKVCLGFNRSGVNVGLGLSYTKRFSTSFKVPNFLRLE